MLNTFFVTI